MLAYIFCHLVVRISAYPIQDISVKCRFLY